MKRFALLFVLSLVCSGLSGWFWWQATADQRTAVLEVRTIPRGATVVFEGRPVIDSELTGLAPGEGEVVARLKGYQEVHQKAVLKEGERTLVQIELAPQPGELKLKVTGPKAYKVRVGPDPERKYTEQDKLKLAPGRWHVEVRAEGYETRSKWVNIPSGGKSELAMALDTESSEPAVEPTPRPTRTPSQPPPPSYQPTTPAYTPAYTPPPVYYPPPPPAYRPPPPRPRPVEPSVVITPVPLDPPPSQPEPEFTPIP